MAQVHTSLGLGEVVATDTVRGRKSYRVAGRGFDKWFSETEIGAIHEADAIPASGRHRMPDHPGRHRPGADFDPRVPVGGYQVQDASDWLASHPEEDHLAYRQAWAPVDHDNSVALPYDPTPQYPAIPGDTESTLQPIHQIDADDRLSPSDSITFADRSDDESEIESTGPNFESRSAAFDAYPSHGGMETGPSEAHEHWMNMFGDQAYEHESPYYEGPQPSEGHEYHPSDSYDFENRGSEDIYSGDDGHLGHQEEIWNPHENLHIRGNVHEAFAFLIPLAEGLAGASGGSVAAGAAESAGMGAVGQGVAQGVGSAATHEMMGGNQDNGLVQQVVDATSPGEGWGELQRGASIDQWLATQERKASGVGAGLSDRYIDVTASADYHNDPVAQFRHDPQAFIERTGHVHDEPISPEMEHYGQLVEADANIREAAWNDVRSKAMRLRREGKVAIKDLSPGRVYASVEGDHGTYDVKIFKGSSFSGLGGHSVDAWSCGCEWGRWAFKRKMRFVGRLCSHGYAAYLDMQSAHLKGQSQGKRPYTKRADMLQNEPQRLVPELVVNDTDDAHLMLDVTKDQRKDTGPDDVTSESDIVHFARVMDYCDRHQYPYPRELTAFLVRHADDQKPSDWRVEDASGAESALNELRDWSDRPISESAGHAEERNDQVRDAIDEAREKGTDASLFTAGVGFRQAAPDTKGWDRSQDGGRTIYRQPGTNNGYAQEGDRFTPVDFKGTGSQGPEGNRYDMGQGSYTRSTENGRDLYRNDRGTGNSGFAVEKGDTRGVNFNSQGNQGQNQRFNYDGTDDGPSGSGFKDFLQQNPSAGNTPQNTNGAGGGTSGVQNTSTSTPITPGGDNFYKQWYPGESNSSGGGEAVQGPGIGNHDQGRAGGDTKPGGASIGQGDYKIQSGDTLSDIAQRSGYGGDYKALGDANGISNYDNINAGDTLKIGDPKASGGAAPAAPQATSSPSTNAPGGPPNQNSGGKGADDLNSPANTNPALNNPAAPVSTSAIPGSASSAGVATGVASGAGNSAPATPKTDTSVSNGGAGDAGTQSASATAGSPSDPSKTSSSGMGVDIGNTMSQISDAANSFKGFIGLGSVMTAQDYDDWIRYAYPDSPKTRDHKPFNGTGGDTSIQFGTSEEYADKARRKMDDVEDLDYDVSKPVNPRQGGVQRLGGGNRRPAVTPTVVRQQRGAGVFNEGAQHEAVMESFASFDPLAARSPKDFLDDSDSAAVHMASQDGDIVAQFQSFVDNAASSGGQYDDFASSPAVREAMMRTAGRNYSLAEQNELIREGDIGGAGNLNSLELSGTHYEAQRDDSRNSVGMW